MVTRHFLSLCQSHHILLFNTLSGENITGTISKTTKSNLKCPVDLSSPWKQNLCPHLWEDDFVRNHDHKFSRAVCQNSDSTEHLTGTLFWEQAPWAQLPVTATFSLKVSSILISESGLLLYVQDSLPSLVHLLQPSSYPGSSSQKNSLRN